MRMVLIFAAVCCTFLSSQQPGIIVVPDDEVSIQAAIDAALDGDTVLVLPGIYIENIDFKGKRIVVASRYVFSGDTADISHTVIEGNGENPVVRMIQGEDPGTTLMGFTITNGQGMRRDGDVFGGGVCCIQASPTITSNIITHNRAFNEDGWARGGGIYADGGSPVITKNIIVGNTATGIIAGNPYSFVVGSGGGVELNNVPYCRIEDNVAAENDAVGIANGFCVRRFGRIDFFHNKILPHDDDILGVFTALGGDSLVMIGNRIRECPSTALYISECGQSIIMNNILSRNSDEAGMFLEETHARLFNNTVTGTGSHSFAAISVANSDVTLRNNIFAGHGMVAVSPDWSDSASVFTLSDNAFWDSGDTPYPDFEPGDTLLYINRNSVPCDRYGNIFRQPKFMNDTTDFHLREASPCIDAGDIAWTDGILPDGDFDRKPRIQGASIDIGAYEFQHPLDTKRLPCDMLCVLDANYPNPFNPSTTISFTISRAQRVTLIVTDLCGQELLRLLDNTFKEAGLHNAACHTTELPSGVYLYSLIAGGQRLTRKMVVLR
ncbi:MAG: right-handed parallel beta-helix repeat-containing protein [Bacteroidetes bacterium]|nr:right-handed parallel beta-helix repeat-containing protein [Bacteroidota bacterium]